MDIMFAPTPAERTTIVAALGLQKKTPERLF